MKKTQNIRKFANKSEKKQKKN